MIFVYDDVKTFDSIYAYLEMPDDEIDKYGFDWSAIWLCKDGKTLCCVDGNKKYFNITDTKIIPKMPFGSYNQTVRDIVTNRVDNDHICDMIFNTIGRGYLIKDMSPYIRNLLRKQQVGF
jgi:hypothetical protein